MLRRLEIDKENFLLLVLGVSDEQVLGLTKMYDIAFINESSFIRHIAGLVSR